MGAKLSVLAVEVHTRICISRGKLFISWGRGEIGLHGKGASQGLKEMVVSVGY